MFYTDIWRHFLILILLFYFTCDLCKIPQLRAEIHVTNCYLLTIYADYILFCPAVFSEFSVSSKNI